MTNLETGAAPDEPGARALGFGLGVERWQKVAMENNGVFDSLKKIAVGTLKTDAIHGVEVRSDHKVKFGWEALDRNHFVARDEGIL